jgi:hypothetical protein
LDGLPFDSMGDEKATWMERPFESQVVEVVKNLCRDKALESMLEKVIPRLKMFSLRGDKF